MKKKEIIILSSLVISLITVSLYQTLATDITMNKVNGTDADLSYTFDITDQTGRVVNVKANTTKILDIFVTNTNNGTINYGISYTPSTVKTDDITIAQLNTSKDTVSGLINKDEKKQITIVIVNNGASDITLTLVPVTGYEHGGDLIVPSNHTLITESYEIEEPLSPSLETLTKLGLTVSEGSPDFSKTSCSSGCEENTVGIYSMEDSFGTSYYFRGDVENNYVKFGKWNQTVYYGYLYEGYYPILFLSKELCESFGMFQSCVPQNYVGKDMYWRIVRINGDGSIRMVLEGTEPFANGSSKLIGYVGMNEYNINSNDNAYIGYMYGTPGSTTYEQTHANINDSNIKKILDLWYKNNLLSTYDQYIADTIFCNNRTILTENDVGIVGDGNGTNETVYTSFLALSNKYIPSFTCSNQNDTFTVNENIGNGDLTYPVGSLTVDDFITAGANGNSSNTKFYLFDANVVFTISPSILSYGDSLNICYSHIGEITNCLVDTNTNYIRPVISIKGDINFTGNGSISSPFEVVMQ